MRALAVNFGIGVGFALGLTGGGGGVVVVPAPILFSGMGIHRAVATSLPVIALVSAAGVASKVVAGETLSAGVPGLFVVGGIVGLDTVFARTLSPVKLQKAFAAVIVDVVVIVKEPRPCVQGV